MEESWKYEIEKEKDFKLAMIKGVTEGVDQEIALNFEESLKELESIGTIEEVAFPDLPYEEVTRMILHAEAASAFDKFTEMGLAGDLTAPEDRYGPYARSVVLAKDYIKAQRVRGLMSETADELMKPYDALVAPSRLSPATMIGQDFRTGAPGVRRDIMGALGNSAGLPAISVPNGFTETKLPTGIQFMGRAYDENKILSVAKAYQGMTTWHNNHPAISI
jgi:aspartyl-tRNA(Asn)/glutamyl-tRNA(Gln) amidotransferase subunit A